MRSTFLTLLLTIAHTTANAQTDDPVSPRSQKFQDKVNASKGITTEPEVKEWANHFYASYDDFVKGVPVPDMLLKSMGLVTHEVTQNGVVSKLKVKEWGERYWGFCDRYGALYRYFENDTYLVIAAGRISQYVKTGDATGTLNSDSTFTLLSSNLQGGGYYDYISAGSDGEIITLRASTDGKSKTLEDLMAPHPEVYAALLANKDKWDETKFSGHQRLTFRIQHYIKEFNKL